MTGPSPLTNGTAAVSAIVLDLASLYYYLRTNFLCNLTRHGKTSRVLRRQIGVITC